jgi:hypothetical protein
MSTVRKIVYVNPIEPAPLSFRAGTNVDTALEVTYYQQGANNLAYNVDLAAQLRLTSRTGLTSKTYSMPAIDVANGKARAVIPAGDITDLNGYRLALYGTVSGEAGLLAQGVVWPSDIIAPMDAPIDVIDQIPLLLTRGQNADLQVNLWADASKSAEYSLGNSTVSAAIYAARNGVQLVPFTVVVLDNNSVQMSLASTDVDALPDSCWWSLTIGGAGISTLLAEGPVTVTA